MDATLSKSVNTQNQKNAVGRIFFLDAAGGRVLSANPDGSDLETIVEEGRTEYASASRLRSLSVRREARFSP
jgi:hypothetical protein